MDQISAVIGAINGWVWGPPMLVLILGTGLYLSIGLKAMPIYRLGYGFRMLWRGRKEQGKGDITPFNALMTSLSATIGTGNIAGVGTALAIGGPGALFWMWITALVGMATKYAEAVLAVRYREVDAKNNHVGGPMYYIRNGLGKNWRWLAVLFALFGALAGFGIGNTVQANSVADALTTRFGVPALGTGLAMGLLVGLVLIGGIRWIAQVAGKLVPLMALAYLLSGLIVLALNLGEIPSAVVTIVEYAFTPAAGVGGFAGASVMLALQMGVARGIFSNEAGLGSAPIAHAAAETDSPVRQGTIAMLGTFLDTIVICTITGLVIVISGQWQAESSEYTDCVARGGVIEERVDSSWMIRKPSTVCVLETADGASEEHDRNITGAPLSAAAFGEELPGSGTYVVSLGLALFAFTTILGWSVYGERCIEYLFGIHAIIPFRVLWVLAVPIGAISQLDFVWLLADTLNAMMAIPNLIALVLLSPVVFKLTQAFFQDKRAADR
ncbi:MAG: alanine/glycine:cation symporter family protein [Halochromatium sp.]|uniref:alanine/glycine:cation symporter family protein n=1 Tax=Halochromatium sp. TaxID=2049430 RepID=UPI00397946F7